MSKTIIFLYGLINHVIFLGGFLSVIAFWAMREMTAGSLVFAMATPAYVFIAMVLEEHDLIAQFGKRYRRCRERVPMSISAL